MALTRQPAGNWVHTGLSHLGFLVAAGSPSLGVDNCVCIYIYISSVSMTLFLCAGHFWIFQVLRFAQVLFPIAIPDEGTFDWLDDFLKKNPRP